MKILNLTEFRKLPEGSIFCKGEPFAFENIQVKGETLDVDFISLDICWIEGKSSDEIYNRLDEMLKEGKSYPMNTSYSRDGFFDDDAIFLIFEKNDLIQLKEYINIALTLEMK